MSEEVFPDYMLDDINRFMLLSREEITNYYTYMLLMVMLSKDRDNIVESQAFISENSNGDRGLSVLLTTKNGHVFDFVIAPTQQELMLKVGKGLMVTKYHEIVYVLRNNIAKILHVCSWGGDIIENKRRGKVVNNFSTSNFSSN